MVGPRLEKALVDAARDGGDDDGNDNDTAAAMASSPTTRRREEEKEASWAVNQRESYSVSYEIEHQK